MKKQNKKAIQKLTTAAMLTAAAVALQYIEFPVPIMPPFIKLDFSDLPGLIGALMFGPSAGVAVQLLKNVIHLAVSQSGFIGELSNFIIGSFFAGFAGLIYKILIKKSSPVRFIKAKGADGPTVAAVENERRLSPLLCAVIAGSIGAVIAGIASLPINLYIIYPLYYNVMGMPKEAILEMYQVLLPSVKSISAAILIFNVPFTIVKNLLSVAVTAAVFKPISKIKTEF